MTNPLRKLWRNSRPGPAKSLAARPVGNELLLSDRRVVKRHSDPLPATVSYGIAASKEPVGIHNFSDKGLCFQGALRYPIGASLEITASLPQTRLFAGSRVRYSVRVVRASMERGQFITAAAIYGCQTLPINEPKNIAGKETNPSIGSNDWQRSLAQTSKSCAPKAQPRKSRRFSRYSCASEVQFRNPASGEIISGEVIDISLSGCCVQTATPFPPGTEVEIALQANKLRIHTHGRVKSVKGNRSMAVEFDGELAERLQRLPRFVRMISGAGASPRQ